jgi:hypothetical protein
VKAAISSETMVKLYQMPWKTILEDGNLQRHRVLYSFSPFRPFLNTFFNCTVSTALNCMVIMKDEPERIWKEAGVDNYPKI